MLNIIRDMSYFNISMTARSHNTLPVRLPCTVIGAACRAVRPRFKYRISLYAQHDC